MHEIKLIRLPFSASLLLLTALLALGTSPAMCDIKIVEHIRDCNLLPSPAQLPINDRMPAFAIISKHFTTRPRELDLQIAVNEAAAGSETAMIRLACALHSEFKKEALIEALIFDDKKSAKKLLLQFQDEPKHGVYLWHVRARYFLDREKNVEFVEVLFPENTESFVTFHIVKDWLRWGEPQPQ